MRFSLCFAKAIALALALALTGCASLPREQGYAETGDLLRSRLGTAPAWPADTVELAEATPSEPLNVDAAVRLAFLNNPRIREEYARLGFGRAELDEARRLSNPTFGYSKLNAGSGAGLIGPSQITRSLSWGFTDLLLLPARKRFAAGELVRLQQSVATELLTLAGAVEVAWFEAVAAGQVATMRDVVAQAAERSAELAQRFFDAGNINRLQLEQEYAAAAQARIAAVRAKADALRARSELAGLIGLPSAAAWTTLTQLAAPPATVFAADALLPLALEQRLDLAAARQSVALHEDALAVSHRWRWLGELEVGYERESETEGAVMRGPSLALGLPIFNQGQAAIARAQAELDDARAKYDGLRLAVANDTRLAVERVAVAFEIAESYRTALIPRREAIVARTQERVNFMLQGVFELILARQQEYDAYAEYLQAVRDYWTARAALRLAVGGRLPDEDTQLQPTYGVESMLPSTAPPEMDHSMHGKSPSKSEDPHAGHRMPAAAPIQPATEADATGAPPRHEIQQDPPKPIDDNPPAEEAAAHSHGDTP